MSRFPGMDSQERALIFVIPSFNHMPAFSPIQLGVVRCN